MKIHKREINTVIDGYNHRNPFPTFASWNLCGAGIPKDNKSTYKDHEVTCPECRAKITKAKSEIAAIGGG